MAPEASPNQISTARLRKNPNNPRRYFNDERLDLLRTSIQEVGVLVPLIVYEDPGSAGSFVLMDGERRWQAAVDLGFDKIPANVIEAPSPLDNLLRMFNIHAVREEWPLVSIALSLDEVMKLSSERRESRLAEMTGLTRSTVRRAMRLLTLPKAELERIQAEAHLDRKVQVHREDLYLEIQAAESVIRNEFPEIAEKYRRADVIRSFARKRERGTLRAVTEFRDISKVAKAAKEHLIDRRAAIRALTRLIKSDSVTPNQVFEAVAAAAYRQSTILRKLRALSLDLAATGKREVLNRALREALTRVRAQIDRILRKGV